MNRETIAAISTPFGTAGISVIRVSGNDAIKQINQIFKGPNLTKQRANTIHYGHIISKEGDVVDEVMISIFHAPKSFTAENSVEISTHGGILVTQKVLERILEIKDVRLANPGEFSERAYLNGRIDLIEAEAIMDIIHAKNESALKIGHSGLLKETSKHINNLREELLTLIAKIEVNIDYPEYDDAEVMSKEVIYPETLKLIEKMEYILEKSYRTQMIKEGINTAIIGKPNVGKSSLLNALIDEEKAIVTDIEGTTRDTIEATLSLKNITLNLIDTAGIRKTEDIVEKIGIDRSIDAINKATLILLILDQSQKLDEEDEKLLNLTKDKHRIIVGNKKDLSKSVINIPELVSISATTREGLDNLEKKIIEVLSLDTIEQQDFNYLSNIRHITKLKEALNSLKSVISSIELDMPIDIYAVDLTDAWNYLNEIVGVRYQDQLLDELFSKFCLGK